MIETLPELVRQLESDDLAGEKTISKFVKFDMRGTLDKIDAYLNSKHISGETDSQGRDKPFFNISTAATNVWYRATDIDRKHIRINATKKADYIKAFLATILLQGYMRKEDFGSFLNKWGRSLARYGSSILKFVEKDGELHCDVMPWSRMIVDAVDFDNNIKIEKLWFTPAQLRQQEGYDQELVEKLIEAVEVRETPEGEDKDSRENYILIYEVHGELPLSYITNNENDEDIYRQQMHALTFLESKETGEYDEYTLKSGKEAQDPFMITHLIEEEDRTLSIGAVQHLFEAQWMQNHTIKTIKDQLDLASKLIFQTADGTFYGRNALTSIENGDILTHAEGKPLTQIANRADIGALQSFGAQWKQLGNEITGVSEAMLGAAPKSGTAWRQTEALLQESHSLFEIMTENKGLYIEKMLTKYILPHLKKKMDTTEEISGILEEHQIKQIDAMYVPNEAIKRSNQKIKNAILSGKEFTQEQQDEDIRIETDNLTKMLASFGNQRFIKPSEISTVTWKKVMKDLPFDVEVDITGEQKDTQGIMETLKSVLQTIIGLQGQPMPPEAKMVFNKILEQVGGISPIEMSQATEQPASPSGGQGSVAGQLAQPQLTP